MGGGQIPRANLTKLSNFMGSVQKVAFGITGGSGEIRTRDQRIKRSRGYSKTYVNQRSTRPKNDCAIKCAITGC